MGLTLADPAIGLHHSSFCSFLLKITIPTIEERNNTLETSNGIKNSLKSTFPSVEAKPISWFTIAGFCPKLVA